MQGSISWAKRIGVIFFTATSFILIFSLRFILVLFILVQNISRLLACQSGGMYAQFTETFARSDFRWSSHAAGFRAAGNPEHEAACPPGPGKALPQALPHHGTKCGYLLPGCVRCSRGPGAESPATRRTMPVVVLEPATEGWPCPRLGSVS